MADMNYGMLASNSWLLTDIVDQLHEPFKKINSVDRLSRHLSKGTPNKKTSLHDTPDITRELYKDLPPELITMFERSYQQMLKQMEKTNLRGKVIAETYINAWFSIHNHLAALLEDSLYLVIDKYLETLLMYKHLIEKQHLDLNILYLADSSTRFPLKPECSENNFNLRNFRAVLRKNEFELLYEEDCGCTTDSGNNLGFGFHVKDKKMHLLPYHGKRCL